MSGALQPSAAATQVGHLIPPLRRAEQQVLRDAIANGNLPLTRKIIARKRLPVNSIDPENGWPLLFYAIRFNQKVIVDYLLANGHEDEELSKDFVGNTALMIAAEYKDEYAFDLYARRYPQIIPCENAAGRSALIIATERKMAKAVELILEMGANVNTVDRMGSTALHQ
ncbi:hypothetical protein HK101_000530 [Irineochytrium annulatum]|nr:hypothetical protein HK101_000530 [Irineochytrium annulatum]